MFNAFAFIKLSRFLLYIIILPQQNQSLLVQIYDNHKINYKICLLIKILILKISLIIYVVEKLKISKGSINFEI